MITQLSFRNKVVKTGEVDTDVTVKKLSRNSVVLSLIGSINIHSRYYIHFKIQTEMCRCVHQNDQIERTYLALGL